MIAKQIKGRSFYGCLRYVLDKKNGEILGGNMRSKNTQELTAEFDLSRALNERVQRVVYHSCLSVPEDEKLSDDTWRAIATDYLEGMKFNDNQYLIVKHTDTSHNHVHLVASRIRMDGTCVNDFLDYKRSEKLVRELEEKYQLRSPVIKNPLHRSPTNGEVQLRKRTGESSIRLQLQDKIDNLTSNPLSLEQLLDRLKSENVDVQIHASRTGFIKGISYKYEGIAFSGSHLGSSYTLEGLKNYRGVNFNTEVNTANVTKVLPETITEPIRRFIQSQIQEITDPYLKDKIDRSLPLPEFLKQLQERGIKADVRYTRNGCVRGINYKYEGAKFTGGDLGQAYTFGGLQKHRKISYDRSQDAGIKSMDSFKIDRPTSPQVSIDNRMPLVQPFLNLSTDVTTTTSKESESDRPLSNTSNSTEIVDSDNSTLTASTNPHREKKPSARSPNTAMSTSESKENDSTIDTDRKSENASPSPVTKIDPTVPLFGEAWLRSEIEKELQLQREQQQQSKQEKKRGFGR